MLKRSLIAAALALTLGQAVPALAHEGEKLPEVDWSFYGPFGTYDRASLQRGYQIYKEVCSACHSMNLLSYRNLGGGDGHGPDGIGFSEAEVKAIAAEYKVTDGPNDQGEMFERAALPSDRFVKPFPNEQAARVANNGALPPDFSLIAKAREGGPTYIHALLMGYEDPPADVKLNDGMYYNKYFAAGQGQIAMPPPLSDNAVTFADGTKATLDQEAKDVATFLTWAAEPNLEHRHRTGVEVILYLLVLTAVLYGVKRQVWKKIH
jgi:ubiquinol-cytochrome c reductase cytochrome c1 subunit